MQTIEEQRFSTPPARPRANFFREEWPLAVSIATAGLFLAFGDHWLAELSGFAWFAFLFTWLFLVILLSAFAVVRHAEHLAQQLGEPLGTLILTLAVTGIEVMMIGSVMYAAGEKSTVVRDAMFAVVMIVLNGMVGLSLLLGGLRYGEQTYNLQGANAFLAVIVPLAVLGLILPNFTVSTPGPTLSRWQSIFLSVMSAGLYAVFVAIQNRRHRDYFRMPAYPDAAGERKNLERKRAGRRIVFQFLLLLAYLLPVIVLAEKLAIPLDYAVRQLGASARPGRPVRGDSDFVSESLAAIRAAMANELRRSINILLGSVLATIGLTIPCVLVIGFFTGQLVILGLNQANMTLLMLTLLLSTLTFASSRTNVLQGAVHLLLFLAYLMLIFD